MATKSMLKNVDIKDASLGKSLVIALEHASDKSSKEVRLSKGYRDYNGDEIGKVLSYDRVRRSQP